MNLCSLTDNEIRTCEVTCEDKTEGTTEDEELHDADGWSTEHGSEVAEVSATFSINGRVDLQGWREEKGIYNLAKTCEN